MYAFYLFHINVPRKRRHFNSAMFEKAQIREHFNGIARYMFVGYISRTEMEFIKVLNIVVVPAIQES